MLEVKLEVSKDLKTLTAKPRWAEIEACVKLWEKVMKKSCEYENQAKSLQHLLV